MERLTEKGVIYCEKENAEIHKEQLAHLFEFYEKIGKMENKLRRLEDLEEELGCSLDVIFKAITNGVWVEVSPIDINFENPETMYFEDFVSLEKKLDGTLCLNARDYVDELELKDYKKTWWLKSDKTE